MLGGPPIRQNRGMLIGLEGVTMRTKMSVKFGYAR